MKKNKLHIAGLITVLLVGLMCLFYYQAIQNTLSLIETEISLTYHIGKLEKHKDLYYYYDDRVSELHEERWELDSKRKDLATVYMDADEAIAWWYISFEKIR